MIPTEIYISVKIDRNGWNDLKLARIGLEVKRVVLPFRITSRYEIFQPFQPERNGFNNIGSNLSSTIIIIKLKIKIKFQPIKILNKIGRGFATYLYLAIAV